MLMAVISRARSERAKRVGQIRYLLRSDLHIARSSARSQSCYGAVLPMKYRLLRTPTDGPRTSRSLTRKLRGQIPASMPGRVIQERLCPAIRGLNVKHDLDIEPATGSVSSLPGNVCLTRSDGLLIGYKVARQFESHPLRRRVFRFPGFSHQLRERPAFGRNPAFQVHRRTALVGFQTRVLEISLCLHFGRWT